MDLAFSNESGHLVCTLVDGPATARVSAAFPSEAAADLADAVRQAAECGIAECFWPEHGGEYRWMFRRHGDSVDVAVMWCSGVITGWQHVFRAECGLSALVEAAGAVPVTRV
jgi:hypothetical protein